MPPLVDYTCHNVKGPEFTCYSAPTPTRVQALCTPPAVGMLPVWCSSAAGISLTLATQLTTTIQEGTYWGTQGAESGKCTSGLKF